MQFGGQTPLNLAAALEEAGIPILGTSAEAIDLAEDRERFQRLLARLELKQPANGTARSLGEAEQIAAVIGYPVVIRPVLRAWAGGRWKSSTMPPRCSATWPPRSRSPARVRS